MLFTKNPYFCAVKYFVALFFSEYKVFCSSLVDLSTSSTSSISDNTGTKWEISLLFTRILRRVPTCRVFLLSMQIRLASRLDIFLRVLLFSSNLSTSLALKLCNWCIPNLKITINLECGSVLAFAYIKTFYLSINSISSVLILPQVKIQQTIKQDQFHSTISLGLDLGSIGLSIYGGLGKVSKRLIWLFFKKLW